MPPLLQHVRALAHVCLASGGTAHVLQSDIQAELQPPDLSSSSPITPQLAAKYGLQALLLSFERVASLAAALLVRLPPGTCDGVQFSLAGSAFKSLLMDDCSGDWAAANPRDLDLFPRSRADEDALNARLSRFAPPLVTRWNTTFVLLEPPLVVEVAHAYDRGLRETLALFDLALSSIGVEVDDGAIVEVVVHPLAVASVEQSDVLLLPGACDSQAANLLSTGERLLRYARQIGWRRPTEQLNVVRTAFQGCSAERQRALLEAFDSTTKDGDDRAEILALVRCQ